MSDADRSEKPKRPVINVDADPHNANWLRILGQRRQEQEQRDQQAKKEQPHTDGQRDE